MKQLLFNVRLCVILALYVVHTFEAIIIPSKIFNSTGHTIKSKAKLINYSKLVFDDT